MSDRVAELEDFVARLLSVEDLGLSVNAEVRDEARRLLGLPKCETGEPTPKPLTPRLPHSGSSQLGG